MNKEKETLITDLEIGAVDGFFYITRQLQAEIRELLTQKREPIGYVADPSVGFDVSRSPQGMPLVWLGKLEYGDKLYRVRARDE